MDIVQQGRDAWYEGLCEEECPHEPGTENCVDWLTGWWECQYDWLDQCETQEWQDAQEAD